MSQVVALLSQRALMQDGYLRLSAALAILALLIASHSTSAYDAGSPCNPFGDKYKCAQTYNYWDHNTSGWYITARNYNGSLGGGGYHRWYLDHHDTWSYWSAYGWVQISHVPLQGPYTNQSFFPGSFNLGSTTTAGYYVYTYYCFWHHSDAFYYFDPIRGQVYSPPVDHINQIRHELHTGQEFVWTGCGWS
jgi:hypothetical protein